ncbi:MAG: MGMT family protein [Parcubacteria group bacterium]|nr:MGMT family protein [Parcubacteria group bacterium]
MQKESSQKPITSFQGKVYRVVKAIPRGRVLTYKEVARLIGRPRAWRAVGNALNRNADFRVPCHRVVRSDGEFGGYRLGARKKHALLKGEGVHPHSGR